MECHQGESRREHGLGVLAESTKLSGSRLGWAAWPSPTSSPLLKRSLCFFLGEEACFSMLKTAFAHYHLHPTPCPQLQRSAPGPLKLNSSRAELMMGGAGEGPEEQQGPRSQGAVFTEVLFLPHCVTLGKLLNLCVQTGDVSRSQGPGDRGAGGLVGG